MVSTWMETTNEVQVCYVKEGNGSTHMKGCHEPALLDSTTMA